MYSSKCIEKLEVIGSGSFGRVFKCRDLRTGEFVAVKEIDLDGAGEDDCFDELRAEISTLMTCDHVNIIRYRGSYVPNIKMTTEMASPLSNRLCIVMDYCERGSLRQVLDQHGPLTENLIAEIAESILKALEYLHKQGISHRDLKGANVLVDAGGTVKLGDFGVADQRVEVEEDTKLVGSPYWMAPEVLSFTTKHHDASKADIWSFGITLIELLRGKPPLHYLSPRAAMAAIPRTSPPRLESDDPSASKKLRDLIHSCLHDDPKKRPSASQLLKSFKSYFKQQKSLAPPGSLARLSLSKMKMEEFNRVPRKNVSETIYSQWDFDLNTLVDDDEGYTDDLIGDEYFLESEIIIPQTLSQLPQLTSSKSSITVESDQEQENTQNNHKVTFRKLTNFILIDSSMLVEGGWENKDISVLPIPCPHDLPNLNKPQKL